MASDKSNTLKTLVELARRARHAESLQALQFLVVNESYRLVPYQLACLWSKDRGLLAQSGVSTVDRTAPFVLWISDVLKTLSVQSTAVVVEPSMLAKTQQASWVEWLPAHALWIPFSSKSQVLSGLLLCRETPWNEEDISLFREWCDAWCFIWEAQSSARRRRLPFFQGKENSQQSLAPAEQLSSGSARGLKYFWTSRKWRYGLMLLLLLFLPVKLTVLAPAELVPEDPAIIRVPIEGVIDTFMVKPNDRVRAGDPLFRLDLTTLTNRLQVAQQSMQVATAEYRQGVLQSLSDAKSRGLLTTQEGRAIERQLEADYLALLLQKSEIKSPRDGLVVFDDPTEWIGKPVMAGERVMVVATEDRTEIEAWLSLSDGVDFPSGTPVTMYLNTTPFAPVVGTLRSISHQAIQRPDGTYAYRVRAAVDSAAQANARVGLRGTARLSGGYVPLFYWIFRKPLVAVRQFFGI
jgi:hypothetical protein